MRIVAAGGTRTTRPRERDLGALSWSRASEDAHSERRGACCDGVRSGATLDVHVHVRVAARDEYPGRPDARHGAAPVAVAPARARPIHRPADLRHRIAGAAGNVQVIRRSTKAVDELHAQAVGARIHGRGADGCQGEPAMDREQHRPRTVQTAQRDGRQRRERDTLVHVQASGLSIARVGGAEIIVIAARRRPRDAAASLAPLLAVADVAVAAL